MLKIILYIPYNHITGIFFESIVQKPLFCFGRIIKFIILTLIMVIEIYIPILGFYVGVYLNKKNRKKI